MSKNRLSLIKRYAVYTLLYILISGWDFSHEN